MDNRESLVERAGVVAAVVASVLLRTAVVTLVLVSLGDAELSEAVRE